jgi:sulfatase modifying factor 1
MRRIHSFTLFLILPWAALVSAQTRSLDRCSFCPETVLIKGGTFSMGSAEDDSDEKPVHTVTVSSFNLGKYEVTVGQYLQFVDEMKICYPEWLEPGNRYNIETGDNPYYREEGYSRQATDLPIAGISWKDAQAYCQWLSMKTGYHFRLPTEAEWEYAARGGADALPYRYAGGDTLDLVAWHSGNTNSRPQPVGARVPNALGLYDLSGNVWEWCSDRYESGYYAKSAARDPQGPSSGPSRVIRGGAWNSKPQHCRVTNRLGYTPDFRFSFLGFRVVRAE